MKQRAFFKLLPLGIICAVTVLLLFVSCKEDVPEEDDTDITDTIPNDTIPNDTIPEDTIPEDSVSEPHYIETTEGFQQTLVAAYNSFNYLYGTEWYMNLTVWGTDEFRGGQQATSGINNYLITPTTNELILPWQWSYTGINHCNGLIQYGPTAEVADEERDLAVAEAKYLRAHLYFILARQFGGVPLRTEHEDTISNDVTRASLEEVYSLITDDLEAAIEDLPATLSEVGKATQASAIHLLSLVHLTKHDYTNALNSALDLINNSGSYGLSLLDDFEEVHAEGNESNSEIIFTVPVDPEAASSAINENRSNFLFRPFYTDIPGMTRDMQNGRPWIRYKPTDYLLSVLGADDPDYLAIDSRYEKSFQTVWYANFEGSLPEGMSLGDTAAWIVWYDLSQEEIEAREPTLVLTPSNIDVVFGENRVYPSLSKYDDTMRLEINAASVRPYIVHKLSETYLIAAEAYYMLGNTSEAANMLNVIRSRAAWPGQEAGMLITADMVDLDLILDERSRELAGESMRWYDLVRTGTLLSRINEHNPGVMAIQEYHILRPIPQSVIDVSPNIQQNPGY